MILDEYVEMNIISVNLKYYRELGYDVKVGSKSQIKIQDLPESSGYIVNIKCDLCGEKSKLNLQSYNRSIKKFGYYKCNRHRDVTSKYINFDNDTEIKIIEMYNSGVKIDDIVNEFKISSSSQLHRILRRKGRKKIIPGKKYFCNDDYFENIDTENKSYWLGFLFADGYVRNRGNSFNIELTLSSKDREHLIKFKNDIESNCEIKDSCIRRTYKGKQVEYYSSGLMISSSKMFEDLNRHGCVQRKSLILEPPKNIPINLISHFIRGYFDGDGFVSTYSGSKKLEYKIGFLGTYSFLDWLNHVLHESGCSLRNIQNKNKIHQLQYNTKDKNSIFEFLYSQSNIFLNRKKLKFNQ